MPNEKTPTVEETLAQLNDVLGKSSSELVNEALASLDEATKADKSFTDAVAKAGMPENFKKKPKAAAGAADDAGDKDPDADGDDDGDECDDAAKVAKAAHEVVGAYVDAAAETIAKGAEIGPWKDFSEKAAAYYTSINKSLQATADDWRKKAGEHKDTVAKADDAGKAQIEIEAGRLAKLADACVAHADMAKGLADRVTLPRTEKTLAEPMKLEQPVDLGKGADWFPIGTVAELKGAVERYKQVPIAAQPPVFAHIFNASKALTTSLPEGWHAPTTITPARGHNGGSDQTARVTDISDAQKSAAMAKGLTIIGPAAAMLGTLQAVSATTMLERYLSTEPKMKVKADELQAWVKKGEEMLKGIIGTEADAIWMLDLPSFPAEQYLVKADHWAETASKVVIDTTVDTMPVELRTVRKDFASRLVDAIETFQKAAGIETTGSKGEVERLTKELDGAKTELADSKAKLEKFTSSLPPLIRQAQQRGNDLKKAHDTIREHETTIAKLKAEPVPAKGRAGEAGDLNKVDDPNGTGSGAAGSGKEMLAKAATVAPGATRENNLLAAAHRFRAEEETV